jgi:protein-tyrosine-phosphatase
MKNILFVCIENSNRSQMAQAFANIYGHDEIKAYSAGSHPSGMLNPKAVKAMLELNYDLNTHQSKSLDQIPDITYDYVITMGCGDECPNIKSLHREDWQIPDPRNMDENEFREIRDLIKTKVSALLDSMPPRNS